MSARIYPLFAAQRIRIDTMKGKLYMPAHVCKGVAVHLTATHEGPSSVFYSVTHVATGKTIAGSLGWPRWIAYMVARQLINLPIDWSQRDVAQQAGLPDVVRNITALADARLASYYDQMREGL